jgi:uncharacterized protein with PIN domain
MHLYIDENLRGLARWLRFLGFDTALAEAGMADDAIVAACAGRLLVTRDRELAARVPGALFLREPRTREQLRRVLAITGTPPEAQWFSRCTVCNVPLESSGRGDAPAGFERYWRCPACARVYWRGSHFERAQRFLRSLA